MFSEEKPKFITKKIYCFFIPIVSQINNFTELRTWDFASHNNVARTFYTTMDKLRQHEEPSLSRYKLRLCCYRVFLSEEEYLKLRPIDNYQNIFRAFLSFEASDIKSLIVFQGLHGIEHANPFYRDPEQGDLNRDRKEAFLTPTP